MAIVHGLIARARWVLSGTPDISTFPAVAEMAQWLGIHLGCTDAGELTAKQKKEQSKIESFQYFSEAHTPAWYAERHGTAQKFLDVYVRQNMALGLYVDDGAASGRKSELLVAIAQPGGAVQLKQAGVLSRFLGTTFAFLRWSGKEALAAIAAEKGDSALASAGGGGAHRALATTHQHCC